MNAPKIRVAAVQMEPKLGEIERNMQTILGKLARTAEDKASLAVFPECATTGYGFASRAEAEEFAETTNGPSLARITTACRDLGVHTVFGFLEKDGDGLYNACALTGPDGLIGVYRKVHLPYLGVDRFVNPGNRPFEVHEAAGIRIGMHICYDAGFPESGRVLSLLGADLLVLPTNWPTHSENAAAHMIPCRAMENVVYVMAVNRVGEESGFRFIGQSSIVDPTGNRLAYASEDREEILYAEMDPEIARRKKLIRRPGLHEIDRMGDRRPGFYGPILEPNGRD